MNRFSCDLLIDVTGVIGGRVKACKVNENMVKSEGERVADFTSAGRRRRLKRKRLYIMLCTQRLYTYINRVVSGIKKGPRRNLVNNSVCNRFVIF